MDETKQTPIEENQIEAAAQTAPEAVESVADAAETAEAPEAPETAEAPENPEAPDAPESPENPDAPETAEAASRKPYATKAEVLERLKEMVLSGEVPERAEMEHLKQAYYRLRMAETAVERDAFIAAGGEAEAFMPAADADEECFKAQMGRLREIRAKVLEEQEKERQAALERKEAIIEQIKAMAATPEDADKNYDAFKALQAEWKEIKNVPAEKATELWKNYQLYVEQFYDQLRLNHEFRAYDFKKNLEIKTRLCESAEKLAELSDPVSAFHQLQQLHQEYRETGPVAKELREDLWKRFKDASTVINKRHQEHFEALKSREEENLALKTALCEKVEAIDTAALKTFADWDAKSQEVIAMQQEWKTIGFTPKKMNTKIFDRFRTACDAFFTAKTAYFKATRETLSANYAAKIALCEKAEALAESTDWNATTNKFVALQKEWKTIGPISHKQSEAVWKRFNNACNAFFEKKNAATAGVRQEEESNLAKKNEIIAALEQMAAEPEKAVMADVKALQAQWNETGHVPFRKKERIYKRYREACDRIYGALHSHAGRRNLENFRKGVADKGGNELQRELNRLTGALEAKKQEVKNYETNLTFLNAKSKGANALVDDINRKLERLKEDAAMLQEKIKAVREKMADENK